MIGKMIATRLSSGLAKVENPSRRILEKAFPEYFSEGKFITRITYTDFVEMAMEKMDELGANKDIAVYKELLKIFPPGKYHPKNRYDLYHLFNPAQQLCAIRLLWKMEQNGLKPDKEMEIIVTNAFSKHSAVWMKLARANYWSMKGRNVDPDPIPDQIPDEPYEIAKIALKRMTIDLNTEITVTNTKNLPDVVDKTWIASCQSPLQRACIERLDEKSVLHVEDGGLLYVADKYLSYYVLKAYTKEPRKNENPQKPYPTFNANKLKFQFFGRPLDEKLFEINNIHHIGNYHILATGITGTSSHDSLLSWVKFLQKSNPKMERLSVLFDINRPTYDLIDNDAAKSEKKSSSMS